MADNNTLDNFDPFDPDFGGFDDMGTGVNASHQPVSTPSINDIIPDLKKRAMVVFFIIDISGSMKGAKIGAVNDAMRNLINELPKKENNAAEIKIAIMEFSTRANWRTIYPQNVSDFVYQDIEQVYGGTFYGAAFSALNQKLSPKEFLISTAGAYTPLIIFMTDGKPSDPGCYKDELDELKKNKWFQHSTRAAIAIDEGADDPECKKVLLEFTENPANIYEAKDSIALAKQIQLVTLTGVDFVTKQGTIHNQASSVRTQKSAVQPNIQTAENGVHIGDTVPKQSANSALNTSAETVQKNVSQNFEPQSESASATIPIDWDNDFNF